MVVVFIEFFVVVVFVVVVSVDVIECCFCVFVVVVAVDVIDCCVVFPTLPMVHKVSCGEVYVYATLKNNNKITLLI